ARWAWIGYLGRMQRKRAMVSGVAMLLAAGCGTDDGAPVKGVMQGGQAGSSNGGPGVAAAGGANLAGLSAGGGASGGEASEGGTSQGGASGGAEARGGSTSQGGAIAAGSGGEAPGQ